MYLLLFVWYALSTGLSSTMPVGRQSYKMQSYLYARTSMIDACLRLSWAASILTVLLLLIHLHIARLYYFHLRISSLTGWDTQVASPLLSLVRPVMSWAAFMRNGSMTSPADSG